MAKDTISKKSEEDIAERRHYARHRRYCAELGQLMVDFAAVEVVMQLTLSHYAKVSDPVRRAVFSGVRISEGIGYLRRLAEVGEIPADQWKVLKRLLDQLSVLNDARNHIIHYGVEDLGNGKKIVSTEFKALLEDRIRIFPVSPSIIQKMSDDAGDIFLVMSYRFCGRQFSSRSKAVTDFVAEKLAQPWRYTPPQPKKNHSPQGGKSAKRQRQPQS